MEHINKPLCSVNQSPNQKNIWTYVSIKGVVIIYYSFINNNSRNKLYIVLLTQKWVGYNQTQKKRGPKILKVIFYKALPKCRN